MQSHSAVVDSSSKTGFDDFRERKEKEKTFANPSAGGQDHDVRTEIST